MNLNFIDIAIFTIYCTGIILFGIWVSRTKKGTEKTASDYFLASRSLPWWAIGTTLIASNISAEQFIGMSGSGYVMGLTIATYEWISAPMLIIIAKWFIPVFIKKQVYTMPEYLEKRYDSRVRTSLAIFWLVLYVFVNLTSVLYLGGLALKTVFGIPLLWAIIGLALFSAIYTIYGGLTAVAWTDVIQVAILIGGGLITTILALHAIGGDGLVTGLKTMYHAAPEKFDMILSEDNPSFRQMPGIRVLVGGLWIAGMSYWGCSQYITQRALAARDIKQAQRGLLFAGYLKLLTPLIVVLPGIAAFVLKADIHKPDEAYPWLMTHFVPVGLRGITMAALVAAIVSALSSMTNAVSSIFAMDIYKKFFNKTASDRNLVKAGRICNLVAVCIAVCIAPFLTNLNQAFQFIQEFTGFVSPGIFALFFFGLFWSKATADAVLAAAIATIPLSAGFYFLLPQIPFLDRMAIVFLILSAMIIIISLIHPHQVKDEPLPKELFRTDTVFKVAACGILVILIVFYAAFW
jgi:solute:Na+ symporter, SSS family